MSLRTRRGLLFIIIIILPFFVGLLCTYEIIKIRFTTDMEYSPAYNYLEGPRIAPPVDAVSTMGISISADFLPQNPVPNDEISVQRGEWLYSINCALCHGDDGKGGGSLVEFYSERPPGDLTLPHIAAQFDGILFRTISFGFGQMPPLAENLTERERWDVVNYLRSLQQ